MVSNFTSIKIASVYYCNNKQKSAPFASHITSQKIIQKQNLLQNNRLIYFDYTRVFFQTQEKRHLKNLLSAHRIRQGY
ncbi:hypothetical protein HMPREF0239_00181 [Clostridium sp. ATCC BAA-442]|nr:hypothetical protein HMPREF0239_00181 [Clostridium sp. ATCC BAA-442]